ncbi:GNAT family N-acetyltransferase [Saccharospirillum sp. MSK14-1]|uniref:GNAT family N-acetyltransferase n=1 Tax=Saccharospirillum sp. MSK14-1 TaxID=1897632 RepID=UPI000D37A2B4|nr:GNAT family N-acetyltransferase [Saccharospirillum sp. MSK14-1]PTY36052.1 GNAT family N-acetyltransferase [Saccharospirillum sp. MSK14-1]
MTVEISSDKNRLDLDVIHGFLTQSYWSPGIERERVARAIAHSLCWGMYSDGQQIGFARVTTDQVHFAYLADVFIVPQAQRQGLGQQLIEAVLADERLQGLRRFMLATSTASSLYERYGFEAVTEPNNLMQRSY